MLRPKEALTSPERPVSWCLPLSRNIIFFSFNIDVLNVLIFRDKLGLRIDSIFHHVSATSASGPFDTCPIPTCLVPLGLDLFDDIGEQQLIITSAAP